MTTLINIFTVRPKRQRELVNRIVRATEEAMRNRPGFISANVHASADGEQVITYEQMHEVTQLADAADPRLYSVEAVREAGLSNS